MISIVCLRVVIVIFFSSIFLSCGDSKNQSLYSDIDVVTGLDFFDKNGSPIGIWMNPNHNTGDVFVFPIPAIDRIFIQTNPSLEEGINNIWLVKAECIIDGNPEIPSTSRDLEYSVSELNTVSTKTIEDLAGTGQLQLDLSANEKGLYRVFYQLEDDNLHWTNIYIDPSVTQYPDFGFLDELCQ